MPQTFLCESGEGDGLGVGDLGGLVLMSDEHKVNCVRKPRLEVTKIHLVIVMVEQLAELGDLRKEQRSTSSLLLLLLFYHRSETKSIKNFQF